MKRKFVVLSAFLSVLLLFSSFSVKALENDVVFPAFPEPVDGISTTHYLILRDNNTSNYFLFKPLNPSKVVMTRDSPDLRIYFDTPVMMYAWSQEENNWNIYKEIPVRGEFKFYVGKYINGIVEFLYSSFDFYYDEFWNEGELFFPHAPIKANFLTQMKQVEMGATLTTLVSLVPLLMVLVISFLAFRKALAWLLKVLHKA